MTAHAFLVQANRQADWDQTIAGGLEMDAGMQPPIEMESLAPGLADQWQQAQQAIHEAIGKMEDALLANRKRLVEARYARK